MFDAKKYNEQWRQKNETHKKEYAKEWYKKNRERILRESSQWSKDNKDLVKGYQKKYYKKKREAIKERSKKWRQENKDKLKSYHIKYYDNNKDKLKERNKKWRDKNKEHLREYCGRRKEQRKMLVKDWHRRNRIYRNKYLSKYRKTEKGKLHNINSCNKRRAVTKLTDITTNYLLELKQNTTHCEVCGKKLKDNIHLDHIIPLSVGGLHIKSNVRYIHAKCNLQRPKNGSDIIQFRLFGLINNSLL